MNLKELFDMQRTLDERIIKQHGLEGQYLLDQRILALNVELAELAQETRCFKFWSTNQQPSERVLDELVDVLHFLLSITIEAEQVSEVITVIEERLNVKLMKHSNINDAILRLFSAIGYLEEKFDMIDCWFYFIDIYLLLGFTWEQVTEAYMEKNKENHDRQDRGY